MEQSPESFSDAELYSLIDQQSGIEAQHAHDMELYEQALDVLWRAVDAQNDHTLIVGRTEYEVSVAMSSQHTYFMQIIQERDGLSTDNEEIEARTIAARQMAAIKHITDTNILSELVAIRAELYVSAEKGDSVDPDAKKLLCAERYADMDEAETWLQAVLSDDSQTCTPVCEADVWAAVINTAFDGEPFDRHNPSDLALVADMIYESTVESESSPHTNLYSDLVHHLCGTSEDLERVYGELGVANVQSIATKLLRIASVFNDDQSLPERDEAIDELLRRSSTNHVSPADIKEICDNYHGQLSPDKK